MYSSLQVDEVIKIVDFELGYASGASMAGRDHKVSQSVFVELSTQ